MKEFETLLYKALRSFFVNPQLKNRIVLHYFAVFDVNWRKVVKELKVAKNSTTNNNFIYELYQKWWKADNE